MKHSRATLVLLAIVGAGVGSGTACPSEEVPRPRAIYIVAMEPPPLAVPASFRSVIAGTGTVAGAQAVGVFNSIAVLLDLPEASKRGGEQSQTLQRQLDAEAPWIPTLAIANAAQEQLAAAGIEAGIAPAIKPIPGVKDRRYTALMENWLRPIRAWYGDTGATDEYAVLAGDEANLVIEAGISNYELTTGTFLLQVEMKLIDPATGRVLDRTRANNAWKMPAMDPIDPYFADDAKGFKEVFGREGDALVRKCLAGLNLVR